MINGLIKINCPECGKEIIIEFDTARCSTCGWFAADVEFNEIMENLGKEEAQ